MKLTIGPIEIVDFKSIRQLRFDFGRPVGVHFITGRNRYHPRLDSNGVGKSSLFDALCFCLYGKTVSGLRSPDIIPWRVTDTVPKVTVTLYCDGSTNLVLRQANPNKLLLNQQPVTQEAIDTLLHMNFDTFTHTIILGQGRPLFFDLTAADKLQLFTDVLELERWEVRAAKASVLAREIERQIAGEQAAISVVQTNYRTAKQAYLNAQLQMQEWTRGLQERLVTAEAEIKQARRILESVGSRHDAATLTYDRAMTELPPLQREVQQLQDYLQHTDTELVRLREKRHNARAERQRLRLEHQALKQRTCPTCGRPWHGAEQQKALAQMAARFTQLAPLCDKAMLAGTRSTRTDLQKQLDTLTPAITDFIRQRDGSRTTLDATTPEMAAAKARLTLLVDRLNQDRDQVNPYTEQVSAARRLREQLREQYKTRRLTLRQQERKLRRVGFWIKGFRDLRLHIIDEVLQDLQLTANAMLDRVGLVGWALQFAAERETQKGTIQRGINVLVKSPDNAVAVKWECWSGGEGQRLRLLGALALGEVLLNRAGVEPLFEVLDEPSSHLSPRGVRDLVEFLHDRALVLTRTIYLTDQTVINSDRFASSLVVERSKNATRILE